MVKLKSRKILKDGIDEFLKRLTAYASVEILEISPIEIKDENLISKVLEQEAEKILLQIKPNSYVITLEIDGANFSSEKFAKKLEHIINEGYSEIVFVIRCCR